MAKELMEIGGFITSGAEIVNHDASLSGNGTVDSPLGLNETVLYEYPSTENIYTDTRKSISFSESCRNFERIRIYIVNNDIAKSFVEFEPEQEDRTETFQLDTISNEPKLYAKITTWVIGSNTMSYRAGCQYCIAPGGTALINPTVNTTINYVVPYKVVGINRKAQ